MAPSPAVVGGGGGVELAGVCELEPEPQPLSKLATNRLPSSTSRFVIRIGPPKKKSDNRDAF